jgi:hypothetical protein
MSHDNRIYVNTTQNNLVVIDSEHNQLTVTHPITQVIEITQSPRPTIIVTEETPNNVSVTEAVGNTVIVSALGLQGIKGDRGADPNLTALEAFTGSIQTQVNNLTALTSSYILKTVTSSMTVLSSSHSVTASRLEGVFSLNANSSVNNRTISSIGSLAFNNVAQIDQDGTGTVYIKTSPDGTVGGLATRLTVSGSGPIGIGTTTPASNLHVYKGLSGATDLVSDGRTMTLENSTTNYINFKTPDNVYAGLAFSTPTDSSAGFISLRQSTGDMVFSNEKSTGYHTFQTADTERLRIANTETTVRNNLIVSGTTSQFTASGDSVLTGRVHIGPTAPSVVASQLTINHATQFFGDVFLSSNSAIQGGTSGRAYFWFGATGDSYINNGRFGIGTSSPTQRLDVVGSASFTGNVTISNVLTLTPQHPLPSVNLSVGSFAVSSSTPPKPHFWDGTSWNALY